MSSLSDKLKSLGVQVGARDLPSPAPRAQAYAVEQVVSGRFQPTPHGPLFMVEATYPPHHRHGRAGLRAQAPLHVIARWAAETRIAAVAPEALAFLDTETTGLAGGAGTYAFMVGVARFEDDSFRLAQFFMRDPAEEPAQLAALTEFLQPCQVLVTFNGKAFDVPLLNTRYIVNGRPSPLTQMAQLDLLPLARRLWRERLPSRALGYLEEHILGAARTQEDVPGWLIPSVYFTYLRSGDARPLKGIFYHNAMDILAMAGLLTHVSGMLYNPATDSTHPLDTLAMARLFESLEDFDQADRLYRLSLAQKLPEPHCWDALQRLSLLHKRLGHWPAALELWQQAAHGRELYAYEELAKYCEHQTGNFTEALHWTKAALAVVTAPACPPSLRQQWRAAFEHRLTRLNRKVAKKD
jgi:hypothetical protein